MLRIAPSTVYALCSRGELNHYRVSHAIRFSETALNDYLAAASSGARPLPAGGQDRSR